MNRINQLRKEKGLTIRELAAKINASATTLNRYEKGTSEPKQEIWKRLSEVFGVSVAYVVGVTDDPNSNENSFKDIEAMQYKQHQNEVTAIADISQSFHEFKAFMIDLQDSKDFNTLYFLTDFMEMAEKAHGWKYDSKKYKDID